MLVISIVLILVSILIGVATKKKLCCKSNQLVAFKKSDNVGDDSPVDVNEPKKKKDKFESEFIKSVTGGDSADILNSPAFVLYSNSVRLGHRDRERVYKSRSRQSGFDAEAEARADDSSSLNSAGSELRARYQSLEFEVHSSSNVQGELVWCTDTTTVEVI